MITAIETVTREQYLSAVHRLPDPRPRSSPAVPQGWRAEFPDWRHKYWTFTSDQHDVLRLRPINIAAAQPA
ncbi:hypothetical protein OG563_37465 [Nocardia vinacea]|uniref:Uncharacterized protein n=1 Tax=Nocardia vinacea TaxID=96468 RepID=A0ABZ1YS46_9NOCA|nr:hypothetical protein [Nocardia vinacea]